MTKRAALVVIAVLVWALVLTVRAAPAAAAPPVCVNNTVQYPTSMPTQTWSPELDAAYRAICASPNSNLAGYVKNPGPAERALYTQSAPQLRKATGKLFTVRGLVGVLPKLTTVGTLGYFSATMGWKIGRTIDEKWLQISRVEDDIAASTTNDTEWVTKFPGEVRGGGYFYECVTYAPNASGCVNRGFLTFRPRWEFAQGGTIPTSGKIWSLQLRNGYAADLWAAFEGLRMCSLFTPSPCSGPVMDYRSALASSIPRVDIITAPANGVQNDGWFMPDTDPPTVGTFVARTEEQMSKHIEVKMHDYCGSACGQTNYISSNVALPSDTTIADRARRELLQPGMEDAARTIGASLDPENVPPLTQMRMPSCAGLDYYGCVTALRNQGLLGNITRITLDFDSAVISAGPNGVVKTSPRIGTIIDVNDAVTLTVNPGLHAMPVLVPAIDAGTAVEDAKDAITSAGLEPYLDVNPTPDPAYGPDVVTSPETVPRARTRAHRGDQVRVRVNGPAAPPVGGTTCEAWVRPRIDLAPLNAVPLLNKFPFAVPRWVHDLLELWVVNASAPLFHVPFPFVAGGIDIDMAIWDAAMPIWRGTVLAVSFVLLAWSFMGMAFGFGRGGDD